VWASAGTQGLFLGAGALEGELGVLEGELGALVFVLELPYSVLEEVHVVLVDLERLRIIVLIDGGLGG
jgi:hypothetical protein